MESEEGSKASDTAPDLAVSLSRPERDEHPVSLASPVAGRVIRGRAPSRPVTPSRTTTSLAYDLADDDVLQGDAVVPATVDTGKELSQTGEQAGETPVDRESLQAAIDEDDSFPPPVDAGTFHLKERLLHQGSSPSSSAREELAGRPVELERRQSWFSNASHSTDSVREVLKDQYLVLTAAGKPVYSRYQDYDVARLSGIISSLFANVSKNGDSLRCIKSDLHTMTFLHRGALYLLSVTYTPLPEAILRAHLDILHAQIIFPLSTRRVDDMLHANWNYDLSRQLEGEEDSINSLVDSFSTSMAMVLASIEPLRSDPMVRNGIGHAMAETVSAIKLAAERQKEQRPVTKDLLYLIVLAHGRIVNIARPRHHTIYPTDLYLLLHLVASKKSLQHPGISSWVPVCLPRFNRTGFVYASSYHLTQDDLVPAHKGDADDRSTKSLPTPASSAAASLTDDSADKDCDGDGGAGISILSVSANREGHSDIVHLRQQLIERLLHSQMLQSLQKTTRRSRLHYQVSELSLPGLRHFIYKSKKAVQFTMPMYPSEKGESPEVQKAAQASLVSAYYSAYDALTTGGERHYLSSSEPAKSSSSSSSSHLVYGWSTSQFVLLAAFHPNMSQASLKQLATAVVRWCRRDEGVWGLSDAPTF